MANLLEVYNSVWSLLAAADDDMTNAEKRRYYYEWYRRWTVRW